MLSIGQIHERFRSHWLDDFNYSFDSLRFRRVWEVNFMSHIFRADPENDLFTCMSAHARSCLLFQPELDSPNLAVARLFMEKDRAAVLHERARKEIHGG